MDLEQQLRTSYADRLDHLELPPGDLDGARRAGARMRTRRRVTVGVAALAVVAVAAGGSLLGTGRVSIGPSGDGSHWRELPAAPLSPRANAASVWTGREVIVLGGEKDPCPPGADCAVGEPDLRDGAAYAPATNSWRAIPPAPAPVVEGGLVVADGVVVLRDLQRQGRWFTYEPDHNRWSTIADVPPAIHGRPSAIGSKVYALSGRQVAVYDVSRFRWTLLPPDPIQPALDQRAVTGTDAGPVITGIDSSEPQDGSRPNLVLADVWDGSGWHRLPPSEQLANNAFSWTGSRMVDPEPFTLDGGEVDGWGRSYPMGGTLEPTAGTWGRLPDALVNPPQGNGRGWGVSAAGGPWFAVLGQAYDDDTGEVFALDQPEGAPDYGTTAAWADGRLLAFGGSRFEADGSLGGLTNRAWLWTP